MVRYHYANNQKAANRIVNYYKAKGFDAQYSHVSHLPKVDQQRAKGRKYEVRVRR